MESCDRLEGAGISWVGLGNTVWWWSISISVSSDWDNTVEWLSRSLAKTLWGSGNKGGSSTGVSSNTWVGVSVTIGIWGITISVESIGISLSLSLVETIGSASITGGLAVWGGHSWPVGVGIQESWSIAIGISRLSLSRDSDSDTSGNLECETDIVLLTGMCL